MVLGDEGVIGGRIGMEPGIDIVIAHVVEPGQEVLATSRSGWDCSRGEEHGRLKGSVVVEAVAERGRNVGGWVLEGNSSPPHVGDMWSIALAHTAQWGTTWWSLLTKVVMSLMSPKWTGSVRALLEQGGA